MKTRPTVVVLAGGSSTRFEGPGHKLEQPFGHDTVLGCTLANALACGLPAIVVTTARLLALCTRTLARRDVVVLSDAEARRGVGFTIARGVSERPAASGWLVLPGDMPLVRPASMAAVAAALSEHPVAFSQYRGWRGHPVGFAAELYSELVALDGDEGARRLVARYPSFAVDVDDPGVRVDIDTPAARAAAREQLAEGAPLRRA